MYIDDMIVTEIPFKIVWDGLKTFEIFLSIEVARSKKRISLSQRNYILDLLIETGMLNYKPIQAPIEMNQKLAITLIKYWLIKIDTNL